MIIKVPKGTQDILPQDIPQWNYVENSIKEVLKKYGYQEIRTPLFEHTELFVRGIGASTDLVTKEMFTFLDRKGRSLTLRPEGTAPVLRAYLENKMNRISPVVKLFYLGPMFRREKPQAGRFRQFHQFGMEVIGAASPEADAEVIIASMEVYRELGLKNLKVLINSVGCKDCRPRYIQKLKEFIKDKLEVLCSECKERYHKNPLRILDCKRESCQKIIRETPVITEYLCLDCQQHFKEVRSYLEALGVGYSLEPHLVRGLDYYTKTAFEIISGELGAQNAIGGGGRYDGLAEELGGDPTPAVGFAGGIERIILAMNQQNIKWPEARGLKVFIAIPTQEKDQKLRAFKLLQEVRKAGLSTDIDYSSKSLKAQMRLAHKLGVKYTVIMGEEELLKDSVILRNMQTKEQKEIRIDSLVKELTSNK